MLFFAVSCREVRRGRKISAKVIAVSLGFEEISLNGEVSTKKVTNLLEWVS